MSTIFVKSIKSKIKEMKKIKEPNLQVIKFSAMDVIATSVMNRKSRIGLEGGTKDIDVIYDASKWK